MGKGSPLQVYVSVVVTFRFTFILFKQKRTLLLVSFSFHPPLYKCICIDQPKCTLQFALLTDEATRRDAPCD